MKQKIFYIPNVLNELFLLYLWRMVKVSIELSEKAHQRILDIQVERRKAKKEPSALNKIASEIINEVLEKENPDK